MRLDEVCGPPPDLTALLAGDDDDALRAALAKAGPDAVAATLAAVPMARANHVLSLVDSKTLAAALELGRKPPMKFGARTGVQELGGTPLCVRAMDVAGKLLGVLKVEDKD